jgi:uncharacterized sulfatase
MKAAAAPRPAAFRPAEREGDSMAAAPPNVLVITSDQQRTDSISAYGSGFTSTPALDRLGREGALCERAYCANPVCTPARASIFSGRYLSRHGAWNVGTSIPEEEVLLSHRLADRGYRTHYIGKAHFQGFGAATAERVRRHPEEPGPEYDRPGGPYYGFQSVELGSGHVAYGLQQHYGRWVRRQVSAEDFAAFRRLHRRGGEIPGGFGGQAHDWDLPERLHSSVWMADRSIAFLEEQAAAGEPFFLAVGFQDPHHPHALPRDFADRLDPAEVPLPRHVEGETADKPPHFGQAHRGELDRSPLQGAFPVAGQSAGHQYHAIPEAESREGRAYYYGMVRLMDRELGRILAALDRLDLAANTIVVFTTDHGELLGDHGLWMKGPFHYEELVRIPLLFRWPASWPAGRRPRGLISQVDIVPTVLAALGEPVPDGVDGVDAGPLLRGEAAAVRDHALVECVDDPAGLRLKTLVTPAWKLTWYAGQPYGELYDLTEDPGEVVNRWDDPAHAPRRAALLGRLLAAMEPLEAARRVERYCYA